MKLLAYNPSDIEEIKQLFTRTFSDSEGQSEGILIGNLVHDLMTGTDGDDLYGFVATENEQIIGGIFFSRLTFENEINAFLLSPVAIRTSFQGKGIGQELISYGLNSLRDNAVVLVFTYGDPRYYSKTGFSSITEKLVKAPLKLSYPEGWQGQSLVCDEVEPIAGNSYCVDAFNKPEIW
jgi:putative acetyltransferase